MLLIFVAVCRALLGWRAFEVAGDVGIFKLLFISTMISIGSASTKEST